MPFKSIEKRRRYDRERKRKIRAEEKEKKIQEQIGYGNLNFGLGTPKELDWNDWKESMQKQGKTPIFEEFLDFKGQTQKVEAEEFSKLDEIPEISKECTIFRKMAMKIIRRNPFFFQNHILCPYCSAWLRLFNREFKAVGVNLWNSQG